MRAVNLIPADQRSRGRVGAGRSGGVAYAVLALLAGVAVLAVAYGKASRKISGEKSEAASLTAQAQRAQAQAQALAPYTSFVSMREQRTQAVAQLVDSRFDWAHAMHEFGRVLGNEVAVATLTGQIGGAGSSSSKPTPPTPAGAASASAASTVSSSTPPGSVPTFVMSGCATSQDAVARMLQRLRLIDGVSEVTLQSSSKSGSNAGTGAGACPASAAVFSVTITFNPLPSTSSAAAATGAKPASVATPGASVSGQPTVVKAG